MESGLGVWRRKLDLKRVKKIEEEIDFQLVGLSALFTGGDLVSFLVAFLS